MKKENITYHETESLDNFGYLKLGNFFDLYTFENLRDSGIYQLNDKSKHELTVIQLLTNSSNSHVPITIDVPARPESELSFADMGLSVAEMAGVSTALEFVKGVIPIYYSYTYLGKAAKRWFNVEQLPGIFTDADKFYKEARPGKNRTENIETITYLTSGNLKNKFGTDIILNGDEVEIKVGNISILSPNLIIKKREVRKTDLHILRGFLQTMFLHWVILAGQVPVFEVDESVYRNERIHGTIPIEKLIKINRIKSF